MSYATNMGGLGTYGGFGYHGLGAEYRIGTQLTAVQTLQRELQRLNFLAAGSGRAGADGYWGPRTATALAAAARYVGYAGAPYTPESADVSRPPPAAVTVPDDLVTRLRSASPAPPGTPGAVVGAPIEATAPVEPAPEELPAPPLTTTAPEEAGGGAGWLPAAVIGGGVLAVGLLIAYRMSPKKRRAVRANRSRRRRRRRA